MFLVLGPRQAYMDARRYLELEIARRFTRADGSSSLYLARESVFPALSAWPVPHDAPYKPVLDRIILAIKEVHPRFFFQFSFLSTSVILQIYKKKHNDTTFYNVLL